MNLFRKTVWAWACADLPFLCQKQTRLGLGSLSYEIGEDFADDGQGVFTVILELVDLPVVVRLPLHGIQRAALAEVILQDGECVVVVLLDDHPDPARRC
jgi:hypothetical protein